MTVPIKTEHPIRQEIAQKGYSLVRASQIDMQPTVQAAWQMLQTDYEDLPSDDFLPDGGLYRYRRYDRWRFLPHTGDLSLLPHEDYFQSKEINQVTGGIVRQFAPLRPQTVQNPFLHDLIRFDFAHFPLADATMAQDVWQVDVHQILVIAEVGSQGHPTPEGVHRDGAEFVTVHLAVLENALGGVATIYDDDKQALGSFRLEQVLDSYLFHDAILWHSASPITSGDGEQVAKRGILTFDYHHRPDWQ